MSIGQILDEIKCITYTVTKTDMYIQVYIAFDLGNNSIEIQNESQEEIIKILEKLK